MNQWYNKARKQRLLHSRGIGFIQLRHMYRPTVAGTEVHAAFVTNGREHSVIMADAYIWPRSKKAALLVHEAIHAAVFRMLREGQGALLNSAAAQAIGEFHAGNVRPDDLARANHYNAETLPEEALVACATAYPALRLTYSGALAVVVAELRRPAETWTRRQAMLIKIGRIVERVALLIHLKAS